MYCLLNIYLLFLYSVDSLDLLWPHFRLVTSELLFV